MIVTRQCVEDNVSGNQTVGNVDRMIIRTDGTRDAIWRKNMIKILHNKAFIRDIRPNGQTIIGITCSTTNIVNDEVITI